MKLGSPETQRTTPLWSWSNWSVACVLAVLAINSSSALAQEPPTPGEALARGPIHEAFASLTPLTPAPGIVVPKAPPELINEVPPQAKPEGDHVIWISGYWAWDDERRDFLWISGVWRNPPPGTRWVPGYWHPIKGGFQWASGYWSADHAATEPGASVQTHYLPAPPESLELGPSSPAPSPDYMWVPGNWIWQDRFYWRPGYWVVARPNWIWTPDHYVWTPSGSIYVPGYWDYPLATRGLIYAPMYFSPVIYARPGFLFVPSIVINTNMLSFSLFGRPAYSHYYFGDYYAGAYVGLGVYPWFALNRYAYNPIYTHQVWMNRDNVNWSRDLRAHYSERRENPALRPPQTYQAFDAARDRIAPQNALVHTAAEARNHDGQPMNFQKLDATRHTEFVNHTQQAVKFGNERQKIESGGVTRIPSTSAFQHEPAAHHLEVPRSNLAGPNPQRLGAEHTPPGRPDHPAFEQHFRNGPPALSRPSSPGRKK
jgi:hypothetical protein